VAHKPLALVHFYDRVIGKGMEALIHHPLEFVCERDTCQTLKV